MDLQANLEAIQLERKLSETLQEHEKLVEMTKSPPVQDRGKENVLALIHDEIVNGRRQGKKLFTAQVDQVGKAMPHPESLNQSSSVTYESMIPNGDDDTESDEACRLRQRAKTPGVHCVRTEYQSKICKSAERCKKGYSYETQLQHAWAQSHKVRHPVEPVETRISKEREGLVMMPSFKSFIDNAP
jgi:hypothetical protein